MKAKLRDPHLEVKYFDGSFENAKDILMWLHDHCLFQFSIVLDHPGGKIQIKATEGCVKGDDSPIFLPGEYIVLTDGGPQGFGTAYFLAHFDIIPDEDD